MRILALPFDAQEASEAEAEYTGVVGGLLVQNQDVVKESPDDWQVVTKRQPTETEAIPPLSSLGRLSSMSNQTVSS